MIKLSISELLASGACELQGRDWQLLQHQGIGETVLMADRRGMSARLRCAAGVRGVWLLRHGWSGTVKIACGGQTQRVVLRADSEDLQFVVPLPTESSAAAEIELTVDCEDGVPASHAQVWLLGLTFERVPPPRAKAQTLSETVRLLHGDWGRFLVLGTDADIPRGILNYGSWAPKDIEIFKRHVRSGDCVLDIGTHVGHHSIVFSKLVGERGLVLSIEAQRVMFQLLNANCVINGAFNVRAVHMAASDHSHDLTLYPISYTGENNFGALGVNVEVEAENARGESVRAGCVDDLVETHCVGRAVRFIKIDVQSYEKYALRGLLRTITRDRPTIFFELAPYWMRKAGYDYREIYRMLGGLGYRFEHFRPLDLAADGIPEVPLDERMEWDTLALAA